MPTPVFTEKGATFYLQAYENNRAWAIDGPYQETLDPTAEADFRSWLTLNSVDFDPDADIVDYDMRGFWAAIGGPSTLTDGIGADKTYDTPYSTTFTAESKYAMPGTPFVFQNGVLVDTRNDNIIFASSYTPTPHTQTDPGSEPADGWIDRSKLDPKAKAKGLMGDDLDVETIRFYVANKLKLKLIDQIMDMVVSRNMEGASTLDITLDDDDRSILRSGLLSQSLDFELDGLWWRMVQVNKDELNTLKLTFETREIAILRMYNEVLVMARNSTKSRAQFILRLIREVNGMNIPVHIPSLGVTEQGANLKIADSAEGIPTDLPQADDPVDTLLDPRRNLTVKGAPATRDQINIVNIILTVGASKGARRKVLVCAIMTATQESVMANLDPAHSDPGSAGVFQQRPDSGWGTYEQVQNVVYAATKFFQSCMKYDALDPTASYNDLCQNVQGSNFPNAYGQWQPESENWVTAYLLTPPEDRPKIPDLVTGVIGVDPDIGEPVKKVTPTTGMDGFFYRGIPGQSNKDWGKEDSWTCIQRLAEEVHWHAFFKGGVFWYEDDKHLFEQKPIMNITESSKGIDSISFDYDRGKKLGNVTIKARVGRWIAQPGDVIQIQNCGPVNGKWLVSEYERSLFDLTATIVVKKPMTAVKESSIAGETVPGAPPVKPPPQGGPVFGGVPNTNGKREDIVAVAKAALKSQQTDPYNYEEVRPYPDSLFSVAGHKNGIDCSSFSILCYKEANAMDPSGLGFNGLGNTESIAFSSAGHWTGNPLPGDIVEYGSSRFTTSHAAIYIGGGQMINIGSDNGVWQGSVDYRSDLIGYRSFFDDNSPIGAPG